MHHLLSAIALYIIYQHQLIFFDKSENQIQDLLFFILYVNRTQPWISYLFIYFLQFWISYLKVRNQHYVTYKLNINLLFEEKKSTAT